MYRRICRAAALVVAGAALIQSAAAVNFTSSYLDGASWGDSGLYVQGFNPFVHDPPDPGVAEGGTVYLTNFRFFKSGLADTASNIRLAIVSNVFLNLAPAAFTNDPVTTPAFVGLSTNTIASTAALATGDPFDFRFDGLQLTFGEFTNYAAIFVNVGEGGVLTPVLVSTLRADYIETPAGSGMFLPETNYGDPDPTAPIEFTLACSNFTHTDDFGTFFDMFFGNADANFVATYSTTPPPLAGDYDNSNAVDGDDLTKWKAGFGTAVLDADGDGDQDVDGDDFLIWQGNLGASRAMVAAAAAPEPGAGVLAAWAVMTFAGVERKRRGA